MTGTATRAGPSKGTATLVAAVRDIEISGILRGGCVDAEGLSASDRTTCLERMHHDVFHDAVDEGIVVAVALDGEWATTRLRFPAGAEISAKLRPELSFVGDEIRATGRLDLSLAATGAGVVRGPMNAFRVKDGVDVWFEVVFVPA